MSSTGRGCLSLYASLACFLLFLSMSTSASDSSGLHGGVCNGTIAECRAKEEWLMDSEIHRRMLQGPRRYVTTPVLGGDKPFCKPGQGNSYTFNCFQPNGNRHIRQCSSRQLCRKGDM